MFHNVTNVNISGARSGNTKYSVMEESERYQRILGRFQDFMQVVLIPPDSQVKSLIVRVDTSLLP